MNSPTVAGPLSKGSKKLILAAAFIAVAFAALLAVSFIGISDDSDATVTTYSDLGDFFTIHDIQAEYDDTTFTLTLSYIGTGTGTYMKSFGKDNNKAPWREDKNNEEIEEIIIGPKIFEIGYCAFYDCQKVESVTIGDDVERIDGLAFGHCYALEEIEIPASVTSIDTSDTPSFAMCTSLNKYIVAAENESFSAENGILFNKDKTELYGYPFAKTDLTEYTIPDSVKIIDGYAFYGSKLEQINFGSNVEFIGYAAFSNCKLITGFDLPDSLTEIYDSAFYECSLLTDLTIPANVQSIGGSVFYGCSLLESIAVAEGNQYLCILDGILYAKDTDTGALHKLVVYPAKKTGTTEVYVPSGVAVIDPYAFMDSNVTLVDLPATVYYIGEGAFMNCGSMTELYVHATAVPTLGAKAFNDRFSAPAIYVPFTVYSVYTNSVNWADYYLDLAVEIPVAESLVYDGTEQTGVMEIPGITEVSGATGVNAGNYTATVELIRYCWFDGTTDSKTVDWKIDKCEPLPILFDYKAPSNLVYDGTAKTAQVMVRSLVVGMGALTVNYSDNVNVGTCTVTASVAEGQNFLAGDFVVGSFTIKYAPTKDCFDYKEPSNLVYDGKEKTAQVTIKSTVKGMGDLTVKYTDNVSKGPCAVVASVTEGTDYFAGDVIVGIFTISEEPSNNNTTIYIAAGVVAAVIVLIGVGVFFFKRKM